MLSIILRMQRRTNRLEVKVEFYVRLRRGRLNSDNQIKEHGNLYNIPEFQTISWNSPRYIYSLKQYF